MTLFPRGAARAPLMLGVWFSQMTVAEAGSVTTGKMWANITVQELLLPYRNDGATNRAQCEKIMQELWRYLSPPLRFSKASLLSHLTYFECFMLTEKTNCRSGSVFKRGLTHEQTSYLRWFNTLGCLSGEEGRNTALLGLSASSPGFQFLPWPHSLVLGICLSLSRWDLCTGIIANPPAHPWDDSTPSYTCFWGVTEHDTTHFLQHNSHNGERGENKERFRAFPESRGCVAWCLWFLRECNLLTAKNCKRLTLSWSLFFTDVVVVWKVSGYLNWIWYLNVA